MRYCAPMRAEITISGLIGSGVWAVTSNFMLGAAVSSQAVLDAVTASIATDIAASAPIKAVLASDTAVTGIKALYYPVDIPPATQVSTQSIAPVVGSAIAVQAPQVCVVASLRTAQAGASFRGRMYVPLRDTNVRAAGSIVPTGQTAVAGFVNALQTIIGHAFLEQSIAASWSIWSRKLAVGTPITQIRVGSQCDTIRHRNDVITESYTNYAVTPVTIPDDGTPDSLTQQEAAAQFIANYRTWLAPSGRELPGWVQALTQLVPEAALEEPVSAGDLVQEGLHESD